MEVPQVYGTSVGGDNEDAKDGQENVYKDTQQAQ